MTKVPFWGTIVPRMGTNSGHSPYAALFGKTRQAVLLLLYGRPDEAFYFREILRTVGSGLGAVQRELRRLTDAGIARRTVQGRQVYYQANPDAPAFRELKSLIVRMADIDDALPRHTGATSRPGAHTRPPIRVPRRKLAEFCRRNHIRKLSFFGSVLRQDFRPDSDIDVLVEFEPGHVPGFQIVAMESELSRMLGRKADLRTPKDLSRYFRDQVVREAEVQYSAT